MMVMLPCWTSFSLRVYAWKGILADQGVLNQVFMAVGLTSEPIQMLYTDVSLLVGMVYVYLPFMVLPLYSTLAKMDLRLLEAAQDLGATPWVAFWTVTVPLSKAGIIAGSMVLDGKVTRNAAAKVTRNGKLIYEGKVTSLKRFKEDVREVEKGFECGIGVEGATELAEGDRISIFTRVEVPRTA